MVGCKATGADSEVGKVTTFTFRIKYRSGKFDANTRIYTISFPNAASYIQEGTSECTACGQQKALCTILGGKIIFPACTLGTTEDYFFDISYFKMPISVSELLIDLRDNFNGGCSAPLNATAKTSVNAVFDTTGSKTGGASNLILNYTPPFDIPNAYITVSPLSCTQETSDGIIAVSGGKAVITPGSLSGGTIKTFIIPYIIYGNTMATTAATIEVKYNASTSLYLVESGPAAYAPKTISAIDFKANVSVANPTTCGSSKYTFVMQPYIKLNLGVIQIIASPQIQQAAGSNAILTFNSKTCTVPLTGTYFEYINTTLCGDDITGQVTIEVNSLINPSYVRNDYTFDAVVYCPTSNSPLDSASKCMMSYQQATISNTFMPGNISNKSLTCNRLCICTIDNKQHIQHYQRYRIIRLRATNQRNILYTKHAGFAGNYYTYRFDYNRFNMYIYNSISELHRRTVSFWK